MAKGFQIAKLSPMSDAPLLSCKLNVWDALTTINHLKNFEAIYNCDQEEEGDDYIPFVACGKYEELDSDMNYSL